MREQTNRETDDRKLMEQHEKVENTVIGLHRPFNMPLKSLVWVCRFSKNYKKRKGRDYYLDFFLWMLKAVVDHSDSFDEQSAEGIIRPQNAYYILSLIANYSYKDIKALVRATLTFRPEESDKVVYSAYKNTSYYITLAKKVNLINNRGELTSLGEKLANVRDYHFFELSDKHRILIFQALSADFFDNLIIITQSQRLIKNNKELSDSFFRAYLKNFESEGVIKYITSFDKNYLEVLNHWVKLLKLCTSTGSIRRMYLLEIDSLGLTSRYIDIVDKSNVFYFGDFRKRVKLEQQYDKIRASYEKLHLKGQSEFGYVNLYDIKKSFRLSYESFNELLNSYYTAYRHIEIILFSNTVSSIDMRRRFFVAGNAALKIRIIKKS